MLANPNWRGYSIAAGAGVAALIAATGWMSRQGRWQAAAVLAGLAVVSVIFLLKADWPPAVVNAVLVAAAIFNAAAFVWDLYQRYWWFDKAVHTYTIFALTLPLGLLAYRRVLMGFRGHSLEFVLALASFGLAIGALWEIAEWVYDLYMPGNAIKGKTDTILDLIVDTAGAVLAGALSIWILRHELARERGSSEPAEGKCERTA